MAKKLSRGEHVERAWRSRWVWLIFALALALRLAYLIDLRHAPFFSAPQMDALYHDQWARRLAGGDWIGTGVFFRAPLYPYFLGAIYALFGPDYLLVRILQFVIGAITAALTAWMVDRRFGRVAGVVAGLLVATHGPLVYYEGELLLVVLEAPLNLVALGCLDRAVGSASPRKWAVAGMSLGVAALVRPTLLALLPVVAVYAFVRRARTPLHAPFVYAAATLLVLSPALLRNAVVGHDLVPVASQGGLNYYLGNNPAADGMAAVAPEFRRTWTGGIEDADRLAVLAVGRPLRPSEVSSYWFHRALDWARGNPGDFLRLQLKKLAVFWDAFEIPNNDDYYYFSQLARVFRTPLLLDFGVLGPLAITGLVVGIARRKLPFAWVAVPVVLWVVIAAFFVCGRFRASTVPLLAAWGGLGISELLRVASARAYKPLALGAITLILATLAVNLDLAKLRARHSTAESHLRLGIFYASRGNDREALEHYEAAVREEPLFTDGWNNLGVLYAQKHQLEPARAAFERALAVRPDHPKALGNLAALAFQEGHRAEADSLARRALRSGGDEPETLYNAAVVLGNLGDAAAALQGFHAILVRQPWNAAARVGEARALLALGRRDAARQSLRSHPPDRRSPELESLLEGLEQ
ncbi:MAG TPA: tetratricopeptide repeat protein [Candidatus Eisenbacteria bacterium]|nr:tetratricopeptide repeat protein [Candidatus Eisenbacteria bacterium]